MPRSFRMGLMIAPLLATAAFATTPQVGTMVGSTPIDVSKSFEALGYQVLYVGIDDDVIEADLRNSDGTYDVFVNPETGLVLTVEFDEDQDGDA